jgi:hypothetical protein
MISYSDLLRCAETVLETKEVKFYPEETGDHCKDDKTVCKALQARGPWR